MKIHFKIIEGAGNEHSIEAPIGLKNEVNVLIFIHILFFILYFVIEQTGFMEQPWADGTVMDFIRSCLVISSRIQDLQSHWWSSIFTYQFVHFNFGELVLSMSMLWISGHILKKRLPATKIILLYLMCVTLSAVVFILSHLVFRIFSGYGGIMEGAFGGALGVMTTALFFYRSFLIRIYGKILIPFWQLYTFFILLSFILVYKHNIAYILVYVCSIYAGYRYAVNSARSKKSVSKIR